MNLQKAETKNSEKQARITRATAKLDAATKGEALKKRTEALAAQKFAKAKLLAVNETKAAAEKNSRLRVDVKKKTLIEKNTTRILQSYYKAYKAAKTRADKASTIRKVGPARTKNEGAIDALTEAKEATEAYYQSSKNRAAESQNELDQMKMETHTAASDLVVAGKRVTKWTTRKVEAAKKAKAAAAALKAQQVKSSKAEATMKKAGGEAKKIISQRAAAKADSVVKKQKAVYAEAGSRKARKAQDTAETAYDEAVVNEETALAKAVALQRSVGVKAFEQKWNALKREIRMNDQDFKKMQGCNKNNEWVC